VYDSIDLKLMKNMLESLVNHLIWFASLLGDSN